MAQLSSTAKSLGTSSILDLIGTGGASPSYKRTSLFANVNSEDISVAQPPQRIGVKDTKLSQIDSNSNFLPYSEEDPTKIPQFSQTISILDDDQTIS